MNILISNDDGVRAAGIVLLANRAAKLGHVVTVVAPDRERSGAGHSITTTSLRLTEERFSEYDEGVRVFRSSGTPADCAMLGLEVAVPEAELVLSGINRGANLGCDVFYSGTVAAAREGHFENRPSIALSLVVEGTTGALHYETAVRAAEVLLAGKDVLFDSGVGALLNVNVPNAPISEVRGFKAAFTGRRRYRNRVQKDEDGRGAPRYRLQGIPDE
ncbi:MAG: 5'/3'-nucleotidase SurE, partial [Synergistaceae bacterium]|nr:5'/3'-nucleotidase SurE [Synergistaceae bacterium]